MKIRVASDLHLEFHEKNYVLPKLPDEKNTILVLAGDIIISYKLKKFEYFFENISKRFKDVIYIMGNHEFYYNSIIKAPLEIKIFLQDYTNIHVLNTENIIIGDVNFICTTLWTDFNNHDVMCMLEANMKMNDFKHIKESDEIFTAEAAYLNHINQRNFISGKIDEGIKNNLKNVVVSHHAPSEQSIHEEYKGMVLNGAYYSNLNDLIYETQPKMWIHGHTHNSSDYYIGDTNIVCNPYGYCNNGENSEYHNVLKEI